MNVGPVNEVVAARAAKRARSGGWGGGVWVGPARSKKEGRARWLRFPPPTALGEVNGAPPG
jgi:hypothetical protein